MKLYWKIILFKLSQGYYNRSNNGDAYISSTNMFVDYIPILVDRKSVINNKIEFKNNAYYINNHINKLIFILFYMIYLNLLKKILY